jgi:hypothetical protein
MLVEENALIKPSWRLAVGLVNLRYLSDWMNETVLSKAINSAIKL